MKWLTYGKLSFGNYRGLYGRLFRLFSVVVYVSRDHGQHYGIELQLGILGFEIVFKEFDQSPWDRRE